MIADKNQPLYHTFLKSYVHQEYFLHKRIFGLIYQSGRESNTKGEVLTALAQIS